MVPDLLMLSGGVSTLSAQQSNKMRMATKGKVGTNQRRTGCRHRCANRHATKEAPLIGRLSIDFSTTIHPAAQPQEADDQG